MTQDEIIEMARQAGACADGKLWLMYSEDLEAFAKLVAAKERDACAMVCDNINAVYNKPEDAAERVASQWCAERIRVRAQAERGEQHE